MYVSKSEVAKQQNAREKEVLESNKQVTNATVTTHGIAAVWDDEPWALARAALPQVSQVLSRHICYSSGMTSQCIKVARVSLETTEV